jgi:hypothetical protein
VAPRGETPSASDGAFRDHVDDVAHHVPADLDRPDRVRRRAQVGRAGDRPQPGRGEVPGVEAGGVPGQHLQLGVPARQGHRQLQQEAVELGLGQRVGALVLDRVLGRRDHERVGQKTGPSRKENSALRLS